MRDLPTAFTRAIPPAASRDAALREHELGSLGQIRLRLRLNEAGRIVGHDVLRRPNEEVPPLLERLGGRIVALLGAGQFALRERVGRAAEQVLQLEVRLEQREPSIDAEPEETVRLGFDAPSDGKPGRAFFTLGSGRHFEARVQLVAAP